MPEFILMLRVRVNILLSEQPPSNFGSEIIDFAFTFRNSTLMSSMTHEFVFSTCNIKMGRQRVGYRRVYQSVYSFDCIPTHALNVVQPTFSRQQGLVNEHTIFIISVPNNQ